MCWIRYGFICVDLLGVFPRNSKHPQRKVLIMARVLILLVLFWHLNFLSHQKQRNPKTLWLDLRQKITAVLASGRGKGHKKNWWMDTPWKMVGLEDKPFLLGPGNCLIMLNFRWVSQFVLVHWIRIRQISGWFIGDFLPTSPLKEKSLVKWNVPWWWVGPSQQNHPKLGFSWECAPILLIHSWSRNLGQVFRIMLAVLGGNVFVVA